MEAYRIERFGSVDGIVLRSSEAYRHFEGRGHVGKVVVTHG